MERDDVSILLLRNRNIYGSSRWLKFDLTLRCFGTGIYLNMSTLTANANPTGFLSNDFPHNPPRLYITAESDDFDDLTLQEWQEEGFNVGYLPLREGGKEYGIMLDTLSRVGLGVGETFAIVGR